MSEELFGGRALIDIDLHYTVEKTASGLARPIILTDDEAAKMKAGPDKDKVKSFRSRWRLITWAASNQLLHQATVFNFQKNDSEIDWTKFRDARLKACLVEWDLKDKDGNPIPCNEMAIDQLHQNIAMAMLEKYDKSVSLDKDEHQKN